VLRVERYASREAARACIVALPGDVPEGGISPFDSRIESERLSTALRAVANGATATLAPGGALLLYGAPEWVALALGQCSPSLDLRAWVAVACRPRESALLARSHKALAMLAPRGERLDLSPVRVPHRTCRACGDTLRDWGGRHRQMRVEGTRLGDVWADLDVDLDDPLPGPLLDRVGHMLGAEASERLAAISADALRLPVSRAAAAVESRDASPDLPLNRVLQGDCLELLRALPSESVDLAFADPPYNLEKAYAFAKDDRARDEYLGWCHAWLTEYARVVRPGGMIAVLTLPTWAAMHARFLLRHRALRFERWVVWDALAEPKGRGLLPAHYALLLFTKGGARHVDAPAVADGAGDLCRRPSCVASRPPGLRAPLSDVWRDIPRIKHARYRDAHPCQLPLSLVERIVDVASPPGGVVLDAFCGTGTTGAAARALARRWVLSDVSPEYVELSRGKVASSES
jgi:site-specific DNA-methyltransferase (adenine-specific)